MEWMCSECGAPHRKNNPPCKECGAMQFEKVVVRKKPEDDGVDPVNVEWECSECGRRHPKNNPPCSRCGHMQLESAEVNHSDDTEISAGFGARDVLKFVGAVALVGVLAFVVLNSGVLDQSPPTVENVPGDANTSSRLDLHTVEYNIYENVNENRSSEGLDPLSLEPDTTDIAEYYNKLMVKRSEYPLETSSSAIFEKFDSCSNPNIAAYWLDYSEADYRAIDYYASEEQLAGALVEGWISHSEYRNRLLDESATSMGVDVHVTENGRVVSTVTFC